MTITIVREQPNTSDAVTLINELEAYLEPMYPQESRHGYSIEKLLAEDVAFFVLRDEGMAAACGGLQLYDDYAEVKRMFTRPQFRGRGFARQMLEHLAAYALSQERPLLRLETGIHQHDAIAFYERAGFQRIPPFGAYREDPLSLFFEKAL
jgi:GNAT superfamily N-acetyltransferase